MSFRGVIFVVEYAIRHNFYETGDIMTCCFFGHRYIPADLEPKLRKEIDNILREEPDTVFYVGNHGSFDGLVHRVLKDMKAQDGKINYSVILAYIPGKRSEFESEDAYSDTLYPDGIESVPRKFAISARNKWMVEKADVVICYKTTDIGGAAQFINMAARKGKKIINLAE